MTYIKALIGVLLALLFGVVHPAEQRQIYSGVVTHVTDGDTLWIRVDGGSKRPVKVRLRHIDAPEICQADGLQARAALEQRVLRRDVRFATVAEDTYGRLIADVWFEGDDVSAWLVRRGHAWSYGFGRREGPYEAQEREARRKRLGLFAGQHPIEPRLFRKAHGACDVPHPGAQG